MRDLLKILVNLIKIRYRFLIVLYSEKLIMILETMIKKNNLRIIKFKYSAKSGIT